MYTTKALITNYIGATPDASLDPFITLTISAVQAYIDNYCGDEEIGPRRFEAPNPDTATTRYFDGNGQIKIAIGEATEITALEIDGYQQILNQDFFLKPYNASELGRPYTHIELVQPNGTQSSRAKALYEFSPEQRNIKVTGKFRYSATAPTDIQLIATQLAGAMVMEAMDDGIKAETLGDYRVDYGSVKAKASTLGVNSILDNYKRKTESINAGIRMAS